MDALEAAEEDGTSRHCTVIAIGGLVYRLAYIQPEPDTSMGIGQYLRPLRRLTLVRIDRRNLIVLLPVHHQEGKGHTRRL